MLCVGVRVHECRAEKDSLSKWRDRFYSQLTSECETDTSQDPEEQISSWTADFAFRFLFLYLYI